MNAIVNALTIDLEDYFHVSALADSIPRSEWAYRPCRVERNTDRLLGLFARHDVKATWFVLGWVAERYPRLVRQLADAGHEVACHGYSHRLVYEQAPSEFRDETMRAKALLEDQAQHPVVGYRAASYSITRASLWALDILAETGFRYDSSIFPVRHDRYGIPGFERWPHVLRTPAGRALVEFPLTTWRVAGVEIPVAGGGYFRLYPYALTRAGLRWVNQRDGQAFIFYLHPWEIDPGQPRVRASRLSTFRHYNNLARCEARLDRLLGDFAFDRVDNVLAGRGLAEPASPAEPAHA